MAAPFSYQGALTKGGFLSGERNVIDATINYRYGSKIITAFTWSYNDVDLAERIRHIETSRTIADEIYDETPKAALLGDIGTLGVFDFDLTIGWVLEEATSELGDLLEPGVLDLNEQIFVAWFSEYEIGITRTQG